MFTDKADDAYDGFFSLLWHIMESNTQQALVG